MLIYIKYILARKIHGKRMLRISTVNPYKLTWIWGSPWYSDSSTTGNFFVTSFKMPAVGHRVTITERTMAKHSSDAIYNSYTNIRVKSKFQKCTSMVLERFFKTFNVFYTSQNPCLFSTHITQVYFFLTGKRKGQKYICVKARG